MADENDAPERTAVVEILPAPSLRTSQMTDLFQDTHRIYFFLLFLKDSCFVCVADTPIPPLDNLHLATLSRNPVHCRGVN